MKKLFYSPLMLPDVNYKDLVDDDEFGDLIDLEYDTKVILIDIAEKIEEILRDAKMSTIHEIMLAHLGAYLGFMTVAGLGEKRAKELENDIVALITREAKKSFQLFLKYPLDSQDTEAQKKNLHVLREIAPCSIVAQTMRLGRVIHDLVHELYLGRQYSTHKQVELFAPLTPFTILLKTKCRDNLRKLKKNGHSKAVLYHINHTAVQIGWLIGYFSHLEQTKDPSKYLDYACGTMKVYFEFGKKYLQIPLKKMMQQQ